MYVCMYLKVYYNYIYICMCVYFNGKLHRRMCVYINTFMVME